LCVSSSRVSRHGPDRRARADPDGRRRVPAESRRGGQRVQPPAAVPMKRASGFTLAELMLVVALLGLVVGATMTVLVRQQQFYRSAGQISGVREQLRQAIGAITTDLRAVSPLDGDFYAISDKSVEFRAV